MDTSFDNLNLAGDRFTLGVKKVGEETVFVGLLNHPVAGWHFAQFLNSVSPFGDQTTGGIIGDVKLGEIGVAYFARDITKGWERKMTLKPLEGIKSYIGDDFEQPMKGAQMPAWVAIEAHKQELLRSGTSPLARIEKNLPLAA